ncbi:Ac92-like protein [Carcinus maenas nudivirus]|uniref:Sulfhydryl oxidase n=1 Tax=Carcinus maenas nudivirus TaxID=2880837 RepID=A0AAE8Y0A0_9VIRU|nr:Ac92-like protein [Carcinus maenas nudivirus]UBZ25594.1 Ac92-like protein [Carcinus maenas nudivirus]
MLSYDTIKVDKNIYKINDIRKLLEEYRKTVSQTFAYIKKLKPKPELVNCGKNLITYQHNWVLLVESILKSYDNVFNFKKRAYSNSTYEDIMTYFDIKPTILEDTDYYKNIWGPIYWKFLHLTSILCKTEFQRNHFAANMFNFNLCMICGECAFNFKKKKPFLLMMIISLSNDAITPIYNLHNTVNEAIRHRQYSFESFLALYNIKLISSSPKTYTLVENDKS